MGSDLTLAIDTETTGPYLYHGCQPFAVSACDNEGNLYYWDFPVDPITREVQYNENTIQDISDAFSSYQQFVMHNAVFDIRALQLIDSELHSIVTESDLHDTLLMSHIVNTDGSHGLKDLGILYLDLLDDDETDLKQSCIKAQATCRRKLPDWAIASKGHPHLPNHRGEYAYCDYWLPKAVAKHLNFKQDHPWHTICEVYAERDVERTIMLYERFHKYLDRNDLLNVYHDHLKVRTPVLAIQSNGLHFFHEKAEQTIIQLTSEITPLSQEIQRIAGDEFNPRSGKQLQEFIYDQCGLPIIATTNTGAPSTNASTLQELLDICGGDTIDDFPRMKKGVDLINLLLSIRKRETTVRYINNYLSFSKEYNLFFNNGEIERLHYLHPSLNQTGTSTTRFSSSNPNGQNIGKGEDDEETGKRLFNLRELFGPPPGYVWYAIDYKSLQLIIFAYESGDEGLINTFLEGGDPHHYVACGLFETDTPTDLERRIAKNVNYAMIFGAGDAKIDATAGREGTAKLYRDQFPNVANYMNTVIKEARYRGYVTTAWGYPITTPADRAYKGVNYIVQGDEGEIVKRAMVLCHDYLLNHHPDCELILQVHDELIFQAPDWYDFPLAEIAKLMMKPADDIGWNTPVDASLITQHWGKKKDLEINLC